MHLISLNAFFTDNHNFSTFSMEHLTVFIVFVLIGSIVIAYAKKQLDEEKKHLLGTWMSFILFFAVIAWSLIRIYLGVFDYANDLPFALCNISAVIIPFMSVKRSYLLYEVLYFWILGGTFQAVLTPDLQDSFPNYQFIKYWLVHAGLVIAILYYTIAIGWRPTLRSILKSIVAVNIYAIFVGVFNYFTGSNHMFLSHKPITPSILDYLGDWPWYIINGELVGAILFFLVYSPFLFKRVN